MSDTAVVPLRTTRLKIACLLAIPLLMLMSLELFFRLTPDKTGAERSIRSVFFRYLELDQEAPIVLVGSSITYNMIDEEFSGIFNLGFDGANALTGLKIIRELKRKPKVVVVEMGLNTLAQSRGLHKGIMEMFEDRDWTLLRRQLLYSSRRENNLHQAFRTWVRNRGTAKTSRGLVAPKEQWYKRALGQYLDRHRKREASGYYDRNELGEWLDMQKKMIDDLRASGVEVILLRAPEAEELRRARAEEYEREERYFPKSDYRWLDPQSKRSGFATTDGIHLLRDDSIRLLAWIKKKIEARLDNGLE